VIKKIAHITENVQVGSFIIRQGGHPTQPCNIINTSHNTRPEKQGGKGVTEISLVFAQQGVKDVDNLL